MLIEACNLHTIFSFQNPTDLYQGGSESFETRLAVDSRKGQPFQPSIRALLVGHRPYPIQPTDDLALGLVCDVANFGDTSIIPKVAAHFYPV